MRGHVIVLAGSPADSHVLSATGISAPQSVPIQVVDWSSRQQKRVVRSTFSAELNSLCDGLAHAKLISLALTEVYRPRMSLTALAKCLDEGDLFMLLHAVTVCRSIHDSLSTEDVQVPLEASLHPLLLILQHSMKQGLLSRLYWCDTEDMLADGLNKGAIARSALLRSPAEAVWKLLHAARWCTK